MRSPGVYTTETDQSYYGNDTTSCIVGMVGSADRGLLNTPKLITSIEEFEREFGSINENSYGMLAAMSYLKRGDKLLYSRVGAAPASTNVAKVTAVDATTVPAPVDAIRFYANSMGAWGNDLSVKITAADAGAKTFTLEIYVDGVRKEIWRDLSVNASSARFHPLILGSIAWSTDNAAETGTATFTQGGSRYIVTRQITADTTPKVQGPLSLTGGVSDFTTGSINGTSLLGAASPEKTGIYVFDNPETFDIDILCVPGLGSYETLSGTYETTKTAALIALVAARQDCIAIIDPPLGLNLSEIVAWASPLDSSYAALYWPWVKIPNPKGDTILTVPPSGLVAGQFAYTDKTTFPWFAAAGQQRGTLADALGVEINPSHADRETLYAPTNAINPIVTFAGEGTLIWGNRTLQATETALDRINVRRLVNYLRKHIARLSKQLVFEPNDQNTWNAFKGLINPVLSDVKANRGVYDYQIKMDATTVTAEAIDRGEMPGKIFLKPTKTAEVITIDFTLVTTGAKFE